MKFKTLLSITAAFALTTNSFAGAKLDKPDTSLKMKSTFNLETGEEVLSEKSLRDLDGAGEAAPDRDGLGQQGKSANFTATIEIYGAPGKDEERKGCVTNNLVPLQPHAVTLRQNEDGSIPPACRNAFSVKLDGRTEIANQFYQFVVNGTEHTLDLARAKANGTGTLAEGAKASNSTLAAAAQVGDVIKGANLSEDQHILHWRDCSESMDCSLNAGREDKFLAAVAPGADLSAVLDLQPKGDATNRVGKVYCRIHGNIMPNGEDDPNLNNAQLPLQMMFSIARKDLSKSDDGEGNVDKGHNAMLDMTPVGWLMAQVRHFFSYNI